MKWINSFLFRLSGYFSRNYSIIQKEALVAGTFEFTTSNETAAQKQLARQLFYQKRLKPYPVVSIDERLRCYGWIALFETIKNIDGEIVEAGVGYGNSLINLAIANTHYNANKKLYAFDSFEGFPSPHANDIGLRVQSLTKVEGWENNSPELLTNAIQNLNNQSIFKINLDSIIYCKGFFHETMPNLLPEKIALLHIDNDLYEGALHVLATTFEKLQKNAIVIFDEYDDPKWPGVKKAVETFSKLHPITLQYFSVVQRYGFIK